MSEEVWNLSITDTATLIEAGELSPVAVVEACLGRIEAVGASLDGNGCDIPIRPTTRIE